MFVYSARRLLVAAGGRGGGATLGGGILVEFKGAQAIEFKGVEADERPWGNQPLHPFGGITARVSGTSEHWRGNREFHGSNRSRQGNSAEERSKGLMEDEKLEACARITRIGAACNVVLAAVKTSAGYYGGSSALMADGAASLSDLVSDGITLWAMKASRQPRDLDHPYGHGRLETIGALGVAGLLVCTGAGTGYASLDALYSMVASGGSRILEGHLWVAMLAAGVSLVVKETLYRATKAAGEAAGSKVTVANAWNHRSDALSSLMAVLGVGGAIAGAPALDPLAGVAVSGLIIRMGWIIGRDSVRELADTGLAGSTLRTIRKSAEGVDGVRACQWLRGRKMGPYVSLDMCIEVNPWLSISVAHHLRNQVAAKVRKDHEEVKDIFVEVVPSGTKHMFSQTFDELTSQHAHESGVMSLVEIHRAVRAVVCDKFPEVEQVTHLHSHVLPEKPGQLVVVLGVRMGEEWRNRAADVAERMQAALHEVEGVAAADIHMDLTRSGFPDGRGGMGFPPGVFDRRKAIFGSGELEH